MHLIQKMKLFPSMATFLWSIPYVEHFSFERVLAVPSCFPAGPAFQYEEESLSHRRLTGKELLSSMSNV